MTLFTRTKDRANHLTCPKSSSICCFALRSREGDILARGVWMGLLLLTACAKTTYVPIGQTLTYPPTSTIEVLIEAPKQPFTVLGLITAETHPLSVYVWWSSYFVSEGDILEEAKNKAMEMGANALIIGQGATAQVLHGRGAGLKRQREFIAIRLGQSVLSVTPNALEKLVMVGSTGDTTQYIDQTTIQREGQLAKMWVLADYKAKKTFPAGSLVLSVKGQYEFNCATDQSRLLTFYAFSGPMGSGEQVYSETDPRKWEPNTPGSAGQAIGKIACEQSDTH